MKKNSNNRKSPEKPRDWPINNRESILELICQFTNDFIKDPSFVNKERLIALTTFDDINHNYNFGTARYSDYESSLINGLYEEFTLLNFRYGVSFLYNILWHGAYYVKMLNMIPGPTKFNVENCYRGLTLPLKYIFMTGFYYFAEGQRFLVDELINMIDTINQANVAPKTEIVRLFNNVLYDLSCKCGNRRFPEFDFSRADIKKLLDKSSELMKNASLKQTHNPQKAMLCMTISNFVLRSRSNYQSDIIYKCVDKKAVDSSFLNGEFWMRRRTKLNDKREGKVIKEVFNNREWIAFDWAKNMRFSYERESFVCSFSKDIPSELMKKKYGKFVYGYRGDAVGPSITTLKDLGNRFGFFSQLLVYDVIYSRTEFKEEMNYLFSIIDSFVLNDDEKRYFLEEIIDYWKLSIKDKRWKYEKERRYEIIHFQDYTYKECSITNEFLKNKTSLLIYPDFIVGENHMKENLIEKAKEKARFQSLGVPIAMCKKCLFREFSFDKKRGCPICGSKEYEIID